MKVFIMNEKQVEKKKKPFYAKAIGIGIMIAVAVYCIPELQEKFISGVELLKDEWRKMR
jgi:formate/nitrite transporter FocA (FNT family)